VTADTVHAALIEFIPRGHDLMLVQAPAANAV
jgi:hypothetical protein